MGTKIDSVTVAPLQGSDLQTTFGDGSNGSWRSEDFNVCGYDFVTLMLTIAFGSATLVTLRFYCTDTEEDAFVFLRANSEGVAVVDEITIPASLGLTKVAVKVATYGARTLAVAAKVDSITGSPTMTCQISASGSGTDTPR